MAERGLLGRILGDDEGGNAGEGDAPASGLDPAAAAAAMLRADANPALARKAGAYFDKQARLVEIQTEHLHEQRAVQLSHLKLRRFGERLKVATQVFIILVATVIGLGFAGMLYDAFKSRLVIVEPFDSPPALAARGLTGKVVAGGVLDELTRLQAAVHSSIIASRKLSSAWSGDIKVEVPETGISIGDVDRMLKARFGHDVHIGGDLVQTASGDLALTVRGDGVLPKTFTGGAADLDKLAAQAAGYVFGQSQPLLYSAYLYQAGRSAEAVTFIKANFARSAPEDRPGLLNTWGNSLLAMGAKPQDALPLYQEAIRLNHRFWVAYNNLMNATWDLADEEGAWRIGLALSKAAGGRPGPAPESDYANWDTLTWNLQAWRAALIVDIAAQGGVGTGSASEGPQVADVDVRLHDGQDAELQLQTAQAAAADPSIGAMAHFVHGRLASEAGDVQRAANEMEAFGATYADPVVSSNYPGYACWIAPAEEMAGHPDKADAALKAGGHFVDCYRFRGDILDHRGDWAGAQQAYAAAVALTPDLPAAYYSWGLALARHGDLVGAAAKLQSANERGPHWADPLKAWGDVLVRQGRRKDALAKYDQAIRYAPAWTDLRHARDAAAHAA
ncbi:MAG: tetratricopeptide repeat protein [Caulobacteraceae bacterium]|nr:tetratricopeptide repeat protein [Caulobacteraceae bacterium]